MTRPPGISPDLGGRNNDRSSRSRLRQQRRHGTSRTWLAQHFNRPDFRIFHYDLCHMRRRRHDGRRIERSGLARGPSDARKSLLVLRQQPRNYRRAHQPRFQRRCCGAFSCLRVERAARGRCQPSTAVGTGDHLLTVKLTTRQRELSSRAISAMAHRTSTNTSAAHGEPLGEEEIRLAEAELRLARRRDAFLFQTAYASISGMASVSVAKGFTKLGLPNLNLISKIILTLPRRSAHATARTSSRLGHRPSGLHSPMRKTLPHASWSGKVLNAIGSRYPWLIGGSADLAPSTKTRLRHSTAPAIRAIRRRQVHTITLERSRTRRGHVDSLSQVAVRRSRCCSTAWPPRRAHRCFAFWCRGRCWNRKMAEAGAWTQAVNDPGQAPRCSKRGTATTAGGRSAGCREAIMRGVEARRTGRAQTRSIRRRR